MATVRGIWGLCSVVRIPQNAALLFNSSISTSSTKTSLFETAVPNKSELAKNLDCLIDELIKTDENVVDNAYVIHRGSPGSRFFHSSSVKSVKELYKEVKKPLSPEIFVSFLSRLSSLAAHESSVHSVSLWLQSAVLPTVDSLPLIQSLTSSQIISLLISLITLKLSETSLFLAVLDNFQSTLQCDLSSVPASKLIQLANVIQQFRVQLDDKTSKLLKDSLLLKTSEIQDPRDVISLLVNVELSDEILEKALEKAKELLPLMLVGDVVALLTELAKRGRRDVDILSLIAASLKANPNHFTVSCKMNF
ncbi:hypothetical protein AB6A40_006046 [Gnathostoma spinigerum]|uniref:Uncharacterized protein n=1 Tax=Gnathostoma spinigerum TaxID=75299 RepID=A0ABD6ERM3_9BILA